MKYTDRLMEIRQWGTDPDAEAAAIKLLEALPEHVGRVGVFAGFDDVDDDLTGNGSIHLQRTGGGTLCVIEIAPSGEVFEGLRRIDDRWDRAEFANPVDAARFMEMK